MKILMLISSLGVGGAETHVCELCAELAELGCQVVVASLGGELTGMLESRGITHVRVDLGTRLPHKLFFSYLSLKRLIRRGGFGIVHAHSRIAAFLGERAARRCRVPFVTTVHAIFSHGAIARRFSRWGYFSFAVSEDLAEYLTAVYGVYPDNIKVVPNGIDTERFANKKREKKISSLTVLFVSRLDRDCSDAAYSLCRAAERLVGRYGDLRLRIVGGGSEYAAISRIADGVNERLGYGCIELVGDCRAVERELFGADVFVGVSRCALEAMSVGVPTVIAGNEGFFGALLSEEDLESASRSNFCARGHEPIDDEKLFFSICRLIDMEKGEKEKLSELLRNYVIENNSLKAVARATLEAYADVEGRISFGAGGACLCGYYGYGNTGDDTLLAVAAKRAARRYGKNGVTALAHSPLLAQYRFGIRCVGRYSLVGVIRAIRRSEVLVFGGGTLFQDGTSLRSMLYYIALARLARFFGVGVELWANGIGELRYAVSRRLLRKMLGRCDYIGLRDSASYRTATELFWGKDKCALERDLAFDIEPSACRMTKRASALIEGVERYAVFGVYGGSCEEEYLKIEKRAKQAKEEGIECISVSMYPAEDSEKAKRLCSAAQGRLVENFSADELIAILSSAEFCVSSRLHLLIFSSIAEAPFGSFSTDVKIRAFCDDNRGKRL